MDYGYTLTRAWKITWKYKVLWLFGILAGCGSNNRINSNNTSSSEDIADIPPEITEFAEQALAFIERPEVIVGLILFVLLVIIITAFLSTIGRVGLISGINKAEANAEILSFSELFKDATSRFWRFFGMNLLVSLPFILAILAFVGTIIFLAISTEGSGADDALFAAFISLFCVLFCCFFIFSLAFGAYIQQAQNAMILEERAIIDSLKRGWEVFTKGLGHIFLMVIIAFIIAAVSGVIIALPILAIVLPTVFAFAIDGAESMQPLIFAGLCLVAYFPVALIANGVLATYIQALWTLTYLQLTEETPENPEEDIIVEYA